MHRRLSVSSDTDQPAKLELPTKASRIELRKVGERLFPAIDIHPYNCSYTQDYKSGPFYEDCVYDDDEMKLSSLISRDISFNPSVTDQEEAGVAKYLIFLDIDLLLTISFQDLKQPSTWVHPGKLRRSKSNASMDNAGVAGTVHHTTIYKESIMKSLSHSVDDLSLAAMSFLQGRNELAGDYTLTQDQAEKAQSAQFQSSLFVRNDDEREFLEQEKKSRHELVEQLDKGQLQNDDKGKPSGEERKPHHYRGFFRRIFRGKHAAS